MSIIGDNIRALRLRENLTQQELADIAQVTRETVNKWESGVIEALREHNVQTIREHFGLTVDDLRSESRGLAAQLCQEADVHNVPTAARIPLCSRETLDPLAGHYALAVEYLMQEHPRSFAVETDASMNRVIPERCHALIDPDLQPRTGSIVLLRTEDDGRCTYLLRRLSLGRTKALLSTESFTDSSDDLVVDNASLDLHGTVFWFQPTEELA